MLSGSARVAGVIGWPVAHSLSPRLHGYWLSRHRIDGAYVPLPVRAAHLIEAVRALPKLGFSGANVTVPHKEAVMDAVIRLSPEASRIGAVNTLVVADDGSIEGRNTDADGFMLSISSAVSDWAAAGCRAVIIGAGGAARAIVDALIMAGVAEVRLVNRTVERAEELIGARSRSSPDALCGSTALSVVSWERRRSALEGADLLVNATTLGMSGQPALPLDISALPKHAIVADIVYVPLQTPLLREAAACGLRTVDGLGMLLYQARAGFTAWFGVEPEVDEELRNFMIEALVNR